MRIISKKEIYTESKSSLAGTSAVRLYIDGNITFSRMATDLMDIENHPCVILGIDEKRHLYLLPNKTEGFKPSQRKGKYTWVLNSLPLCNYLSTLFASKIEKRKPLELKISEGKDIGGYRAFKLSLPDNNF